MAQVQKKTDALDARLAALAMPKGGFSQAAREAALARLTQMGLPGRRDEYWRYTDPALLNADTATELRRCVCKRRFSRAGTRFI